MPLRLHMIFSLTEFARFHVRAVPGVSPGVHANNYLAADSGNITAQGAPE